jgi:peptide/nickel transport system permease protein
VHRWRDTLVSVLALISYATPLFWMGLMLIVVFSLRVGWFPTSGMETVAALYDGWRRALDIAHHLVLPALTLSLFYLALYTRLMRAAMLEQAGMDYVATARAKGLSERRVIVRHAMRNALIPLTTQVALDIGAIAGGLIITEAIFEYPGMGRFFVDAISRGDYQQVLPWLMVAVTFVIVFNLIADVMYAVLDPRIRYT